MLLELLSLDFSKVNVSEGSDSICRYNINFWVITDWETRVELLFSAFIPISDDFWVMGATQLVLL